MDEVQLAERLIGYDTSRRSDLRVAMDFAAGWLEARDIPVETGGVRGREYLRARVGSGTRRILWHAHLDVVPGHEEQFVPRRSGDRLYGRGAYDMKGALAAMMLALGDLAPGVDGVQVELVVTPDEERADPGPNTTEMLVAEGLRADFVICGEPTDLQVGVQAKGVLMLRIGVAGVAAHGSTPWLGRNAVLDAVDLYRRLEALPFAAESSALYARPSINLGRISGGDAVNKVPDHCRMDVDIRYLPGQDPRDILAQVQDLGGADVEVLLERPPADVPPDDPHVTLLLEAVGAYEPSVASIGRDGASDAVAFLSVGVPAIEFGPCGAGHHGPEEHVDVPSLAVYRKALVDFVRLVSARGAA
ncbi:MAG: M20/M25/M40 family metallo-hydrolase, partial [Actinomycetota bacterium]